MAFVKITSDEIVAIKERLNAEMNRRKYNGSLTTYAGDIYQFESIIAKKTKINKDYYNKIAEPLNAVTVNYDLIQDGELKHIVYTEITGNNASFDNVLAAYEATSIETTVNDCASSCSGLCITACSTACTSCTGGCSTSCTGGCNTGCSGCSGSCSGSCSGGCSGGCDGGCSGSCSGECGNDCGTACSRLCDTGSEDGGSFEGNCGYNNCSGSCDDDCGSDCVSVAAANSY